jgi:hypothetical protein
MALPDWLREQSENHFSGLSKNINENDNLSVKLGGFPYKLSLKTDIHQSVDGTSRSLKMNLYFHNDKNVPTKESAVLTTSVPFADESSLALAKNERSYMVDKLFSYIAERLSLSASPKILQQSLSAMIDKYLDRDAVKNSDIMNAVRPETKATEFIRSSVVKKEGIQKSTPSKTTGYKRGGKTNGSAPLWKVPPVAMVGFLQEKGAIEIVKREPNTTLEDNFYITMKGQEDKKPVKISMVKVPNATSESLRFVFQHNRQGGSGAHQLIKELVESHGLLSEFNQGDQSKVFDNFVNSLTDKPDWSGFDVELMKSSIQSLGENAQARQPISYAPEQKSFSIAKFMLCNWRGLSEDRVRKMVSDGTIRSGEYHNVNRNNISAGGFFYYNKYVSADKPIYEEPDGKVARFQRMMKLKEGGKDKLKKFASGGNKGYFAGTPKKGADVLWLTEASLDADSMQELNDLAEAYGVPRVEDNCIALLSTSGLKEFLAQRFGLFVKTQKDRSGKVISSELMKETRTVKNKVLDSGDQGVLKRYFSTPIHFVTDGSNEANMSLSKLKDIATFALGEEPAINVIDESQQRAVIKGFGETNGTLGVNKVFDKVSVEEFMHTHKLTSKYSADSNKMVWSVDVERFERKPFKQLAKHEVEHIQANSKRVLHDLLGVKSLGSAFDNDKAGKEVANELKMLCEAINIPFGTFTPQPMTVQLRSNPVFVKDHNDVLMSVRGLINEGRHDECKALLASWSSSCELAPELNVSLENKQEVPNGKLTR